MLSKKTKIDIFINEFNLKYKSQSIYLWAIMLISYYNNHFEMIVDIYKQTLKLNDKRIKVFEKLISNNYIFFEEYIIDFFYKIKFKNYKFNIYNFIIESLMLISQSRKKIDLVYLVYLSNLNSTKTQIECLQELLIFNNMVINYLKN
tara:strand:+ start:2867 stop:3307 length:441 start_codon:yes stop_codon:yes gene_type:complete